MRILLVGIQYSPELTGIGKYTGEMGAWLAKKGHEVRVITAPPYYPAWRVDKPYSAWRWKREIVEGAGVWRCPLYVPSRLTGIKRIFYHLSFAVSSFPVMVAAVFWKPQIIWTVAPSLLTAPGALLTALLCKARVWLHIQDFEIDLAFDLGILKTPFIRRLVIGMERNLLRGFDRVSTISGGMRERLASKGVNPGKTVLFPNWVDLNAIKPVPGLGDTMRESLGIPKSAVVALYSGNMGAKQGLDVLGEVAQKLSGNKDIFFVFCGEGACKEELVGATRNLPNVRFIPLQSVEKLNELLNMADIHLLPQRKGTGDLVMPSRLTGMLASGKPVVAMADAGSEVCGRGAGAGLVVVPPGDAGAFADALASLAGSPDAREERGKRGRAWAEANLDKERILAEFERQMLEQIPGRPAN